jgi:hypothetical protein
LACPSDWSLPGQHQPTLPTSMLLRKWAKLIHHIINYWTIAHRPFVQCLYYMY